MVQIFMVQILMVQILAGVVSLRLYGVCKQNYYRPPEGGRLYDMKVVSGYAFLRTYYI